MSNQIQKLNPNLPICLISISAAVSADVMSRGTNLRTPLNQSLLILSMLQYRISHGIVGCTVGGESAL